VSCFKMEKLKLDVRFAEADANQQHLARRLFLESYSPGGDIDERPGRSCAVLLLFEAWPEHYDAPPKA